MKTKKKYQSRSQRAKNSVRRAAKKRKQEKLGKAEDIVQEQEAANEGVNVQPPLESEATQSPEPVAGGVKEAGA